MTSKPKKPKRVVLGEGEAFYYHTTIYPGTLQILASIGLWKRGGYSGHKRLLNYDQVAGKKIRLIAEVLE